MFTKKNKPPSKKSNLKKNQSLTTRKKSNLNLIPPPNKKFRIITPNVRSIIKKTKLPKPNTKLTKNLSNISKKNISNLKYKFYKTPTTINTPNFFSKKKLTKKNKI